MLSLEVPFTDGDDTTAVPGVVGGAEMTAGVGMVVPRKERKKNYSTKRINSFTKINKHVK